MDKNWVLEQIAAGEIDSEALEEYIKTSRPDLLPALRIWQHRRTTRTSADQIGHSAISANLMDIALKVLEKMEDIHQELHDLRLLTQRQQKVNLELAQALEGISEALDVAFSALDWEPETQDNVRRGSPKPAPINGRRQARTGKSDQ